MPNFKEMDPDLIRELLKGQENVIAPAVEKEQAFLQNIPCPSCYGSTEAQTNSKRPFVKGKILVNKIMVCLTCKAEFDPGTRVISKAPSPTGQIDPLPSR